MTRWSRTQLLVATASLLVVIGVGPLLYAIWEGANAQPLAAPFSLKQGKWTSPYFRTYLGGEYQIDIDFLPYMRSSLNLDWKIEDSQGNVLQQGAFSDVGASGASALHGASLEQRGNTVLLGQYRSRFGRRQRIVTEVHQDVRGGRMQARLEIGQPEISLDLSYGIFAILAWAALTAGAGFTIFFCLLLRRVMRGQMTPPTLPF